MKLNFINGGIRQFYFVSSPFKIQNFKTRCLPALRTFPCDYKCRRETDCELLMALPMSPGRFRLCRREVG